MKYGHILSFHFNVWFLLNIMMPNRCSVFKEQVISGINKPHVTENPLKMSSGRVTGARSSFQSRKFSVYEHFTGEQDSDYMYEIPLGSWMLMVLEPCYRLPVPLPLILLELELV